MTAIITTVWSREYGYFAYPTLPEDIKVEFEYFSPVSTVHFLTDVYIVDPSDCLEGKLVSMDDRGGFVYYSLLEVDDEYYS